VVEPKGDVTGGALKVAAWKKIICIRDTEKLCAAWLGCHQMIFLSRMHQLILLTAHPST